MAAGAVVALFGRCLRGWSSPPSVLLLSVRYWKEFVSGTKSIGYKFCRKRKKLPGRGLKTFCGLGGDTLSGQIPPLLPRFPAPRRPSWTRSLGAGAAARRPPFAPEPARPHPLCGVCLLRGWPLPRGAATEYTRANPNSVNLSAFYWQRAPRRQQPPRSCVCRELHLQRGPHFWQGSARTSPGKKPGGCCKTTGNLLLFSVFYPQSQ